MASISGWKWSLPQCGNGLVGAGMSSISVREYPLCRSGKGLYLSQCGNGLYRWVEMTSMSVGELSLFLCGNGLYLWVEMASTSVGELSLFLCGNNLVGARMDSISVREWPRRSRNVLYVCAGISSVSVR
ncbi:hypothetical protein CDAR_60761 [Caerostris darwini]|uniref:Uncharacterized protein n=1 Tax=Caerostris darwini TaxID=1538125 RepID=A0AAV4VJF6_9ARAC|nr:hypothetical protein CDAR_60761 [Caerostris darwini]